MNKEKTNFLISCDWVERHLRQYARKELKRPDKDKMVYHYLHCKGCWGKVVAMVNEQ